MVAESVDRIWLHIRANWAALNPKHQPRKHPQQWFAKARLVYPGTIE